MMDQKDKPRNKREISKKTNKCVATKNTAVGGSEALSLTPVEIMTSRDFHLDYNAHIDMIGQYLKDTVRIDAFRAAILNNRHLFKGKCVLNIGCGIGIYALFAAKAGAAKVFAVDSSNVVYYTRQIVQANGYSEIIEVIKGNVEDIELPVAEVDIIVSDWMGYSLLFESACDSVIFARDKWLKKSGGLIFPDHGKLYIVGLEDTKHKNGNIDWWTSVYGFNMRCLRNVALTEPRYHSIKPNQVISKQFPIKSLNLNTATLEDLNFRSKFMLPIQKTGLMDGVALYFHVYFTKSHTPLGFSTDPWSPRTNWLQTLFFFDHTVLVNEGSLYYGGIEFTSPAKTVNNNDIIVNLEMLLGDPKQADVEFEMSWHFKQTPAAAAAIAAAKKIAFEENENILKTNKQIAQTVCEKTNQKNSEECKKITKTATTCKKTISCSGLVVTTDSYNGTIIIGKHNYSSRKCRKSKCKYPKKE